MQNALKFRVVRMKRRNFGVGRYTLYFGDIELYSYSQCCQLNLYSTLDKINFIYDFICMSLYYLLRLFSCYLSTHYFIQQFKQYRAK